VTTETRHTPEWKEQDRLRALETYGILDSPSEPAFDDLVRMAAQDCDVPIALITFVAGDRQWFKARVGIEERETPLHCSICAYAIRQRELFVVPDAAADSRFADNPLVSGARVRFYAGAVLETPDGLPLGTVAVVDVRPRTLTAKQAFTLEALARQVMAQLELRRALKEKSASEQRYRFLADGVPQIVWTATPEGVVDYYNRRWFDYVGTGPGQTTRAGWTVFLHPDDIEKSTAAWRHCVAARVPYEIECRMRRGCDATYRWHLVRAFPMKDEGGDVVQWVGSCTDIDDRRKLSERLSEAAAKFRSLFDQAAVFAGILTPDGVIIEANRLCVEGCGYQSAQVLGRPFWEGGWWRGSTSVQEKIRLGVRQAADGVSYGETLPYQLADGTERMADLEIHPIRNAEGKVIFLNPTGTDVTERHRAHAQAEFLAHLTQKLSTVSDASEISRIATLEIGRFLHTDRCYCFQVLPGYEQVHVLQDWHIEGKHSLVGDHLLKGFGTAPWREALRQGPVSFEDVRTHPWTRDFLDGYKSLGLIAYALAPFYHEGSWVACLGVSSDTPRRWTEDEKALLENAVARVWPLIERARIEGALRESEQRFRAMSDNIAPLAWMAGADGKLFWYNKRWYEYTGENFDTMKGDGWARVHDPVHLPHVFATWHAAIAHGHPWEDTFPLRARDGAYRWFLSRAYPIRDDQGRITLWFGTNTDITELREAQEALRAANVQLGDRAAHLEAIVQQRTQKLSETIGELEAFSYSISHDMRSPLRSMIGFAEILKEDYGAHLDAPGRDYLNRISAASRRMDRLIQDVLNFSRLSSRDIALEPVDTAALIQDVIRSYPNLHADIVAIRVESILPRVRGNDALLTQCFSNLLENGAKFVAKGTKPCLRVWSESADGRAKIFFQDNGIGMPTHALERIFEIFHRVGRETEGTGIGLAIVKKAVEKMGGTVDVRSEPGQGSLFWLDLALA
jgi:PAS domain S-box-containing protein